MLVITRKVGEQIAIGDAIRVTVVRLNGNSVRIGVEAPAELTVVREELGEWSARNSPSVAEVDQAKQ